MSLTSLPKTNDARFLASRQTKSASNSLKSSGTDVIPNRNRPPTYSRKSTTAALPTLTSASFLAFLAGKPTAAACTSSGVHRIKSSLIRLAAPTTIHSSREAVLLPPTHGSYGGIATWTGVGKTLKSRSEEHTSEL